MMEPALNYLIPESPKELLIRWLKRSRESQFAHYEAAKNLSKYNYFLGIPTVVSSGIVGTSVFASLGRTADPSLQIFVGLISVLAAVLAALQTFLRFSELDEKHRSIAARYGAVRRRIEEILALKDEAIMASELTSIRMMYDKLSEDAPNVSDRIWAKTQIVLSE